MKKNILFILFILSLNLNAYFDLSLAHGISAGNVGIIFAGEEKGIVGDLVTYKIMEDSTKLGLTINLVSLGYAEEEEFLLYKMRDPFSLEVSWDPLFELNEILRSNIFFKVSDYISGDRPIEYLTGVRIGANIIPASTNYTGYPFIYIESGLRNFEDFYASIHFDLILYYGLEYGFLDNVKF